MDLFKTLCCSVALSIGIVQVTSAAPSTAVQVREATAAYRNTLSKKNHVVSQQDMVDVASEIPTIVLDLKYATDDNFTGKAVYTQARCFLRRAVVEKLKKVQSALQKQGLGLKIWDGYRPYTVQQIFWDRCPDERYVGDPAKGSKHNRGAAVDLTLINLTTKAELSMPSAFDDFTSKAHRIYAAMTPEAAKNCKLLEDLMVANGFKPFESEWWHYNDNAWESYPLLDISFEELAKAVAPKRDAQTKDPGAHTFVPASDASQAASRPYTKKP